MSRGVTSHGSEGVAPGERAVIAWTRFVLAAMLEPPRRDVSGLQNLGRLAVPTVATWFLVDLFDDDGRPMRVAATHADAAVQAELERLGPVHPLAPGAPDGARALVREGSRLVTEPPPEGLPGRLEMTSALVVPMRARDRTLGVLTFGRDARREPFGVEELPLAEQFAVRTAMVVDNALLERRMAESLGQLEVLVDQAPIGLVFLDRHLQIVRINEGMARVARRPPEELVGRGLVEVLGEPAEPFLPLFRRVLDTGEAVQDEVLPTVLPGAIERGKRYRGSFYPVRGEGGDLMGVAAIVADTTRRDEAEERVRESEARLSAIVDAAPNAILGIDARGRIVTVNAQGCAMFGFRADELVGRSVEDLIPERFLAEYRTERAAFLRRPFTRSLGVAGDLWALRSDGSEFPVEISVGPTRGGGQLLVTAVVADITLRKSLEDQLVHQAVRDPLTDLPNRRLLLDRLEHALLSSRRTGTRVAVLMTDVDAFKDINDSHGHEVGDELLVALAPRLVDAVRESDTVARLGGDEFVVLCEGVTDEDEAFLLADRLSSAWRGSFALSTGETFVTASTGIALSEPDDDPAALLRKADAAMYRAKEGGRGRREAYDEHMRARSLERLRLERDMRRALDRAELRIAYQPIVSLSDDRPIGLEALLRWDHPDREALGPAEFIPVAEQSGLIVPMGKWVLGEACAEVARWNGVLGTGRSPLLGVNLSGRQLEKGDVAGDVRGALADSGLDPACLCLEVTESVLMEHEEGLEILRELKALGVQTVLDDFGTGYSSLSYLQRFPIDTLKIDRSFVSGLGRDRESSAIVEAIVTMAKALEISVVAEGVETPGQLALLRAMGCDRVQGFHFAPPLPASAAQQFMGRGPSPPLA